MSDLISRQAVIDAFFSQSDNDGWWVGTAQDAETLLKGLPSAEPVKHGRWKHHQYGNTAGYYECDNCGKINSYKSNYCPKCGADMRGGENETDIR